MSSTFEFDAFISYNRNDRGLASRLERDLERFVIPKVLRTGRRHLKVFRDTDDMTGSDYEKAIRRHLDASRKLIVVCSPRSRSSSFVNEEIAYFIEGHSPEAVIPILFDGIPNNETDDESLLAFPRALVEAMEMPLGIDYRSWSSGSLSRRQFRNQWYTVLAGLVGTSRDQIEQRDRRQKAARWRLAGGLAVIVLSVTGFLAERWWSTKAENDAAAALQAAVGMADIQDRAVALSQLSGLPEPKGALQAVLANADALSAISLESEHGGNAKTLWDEREGGAIVSDNITPLPGNTLDPNCDFRQPPEQTLRGMISPDGTLEVYLYQNHLFIQRADEYGVASAYCLPFYDRDNSSGTTRWREGTDTLEGRIGFGEWRGRPAVLIKAINAPFLDIVPAYRPGARSLRLSEVEHAEFAPDGNLLVTTHREERPRRVKLPAAVADDHVDEAPECFEYEGEEKPLADILEAQGHPGFEGDNSDSYTAIRGCYLDYKQILAMVTGGELPMKILALSLDDLARKFQVITVMPDCVAFGHRSLAYCENGGSLRQDFIKEVGVVQFDAGSVTRRVLDDENWLPHMNAYAITSADGRRILLWANLTPDYTPDNPPDNPANIWLDAKDGMDPFLIDKSPARIEDAAFSPDSQYLFILREDGTMKTWSFDIETLKAELAERVADLASGSTPPEN